MKPLRAFSIFNSLAYSIVEPFVSFFTASIGITNFLLALTTSGTTAFPGMIQLLLTSIAVKAKRLIIIGSASIGISWLIIGITFLHNQYFPIVYIIITLFLGVLNFGWLLILDKVSLTQRGVTLAYYSFYGTIGGLLATLITGFVVGGNLSLMRYFFILSGGIYLLNSYIISKVEVEVEFSKKENSMRIALNGEVKKFLLISFIFFFIWSTAWPLFPIAQVYKFHMNETQIAIINVISGVSTLFLQKVIGRLVDRSRKLVMFLGRLGLITFPLAYAFSTNVYELYIFNIVSGFTNSASISYTAYLFDSSNYAEKRISIALYNMANGVGALLGSTISNYIFQIVSQKMPLIMTINLMLTIIAGLRFLASLLYLKIKVPSK